MLVSDFNESWKAGGFGAGETVEKCDFKSGLIVKINSSFIELIKSKLKLL